MSVITLGGLAGGGARLLGPKLSEKLGADYIDRNIISTIAEYFHSEIINLPSLDKIVDKSTQEGG